MPTSLTLFYSLPLSPVLIQQVTSLLVASSIDSTYTCLGQQPACHIGRWHWSAPNKPAQQQEQIKQLSKQLDGLLASFGNENKHSLGQFDYVLRHGELKPAIRLAVFDMDSTLIQAEVMDELAYRAGIGEQVAAITARAMAGEIDFPQSFRQRLSLLKGLPVDTLAAIYDDITLMIGAERLMKNLRQQGVYCVILSGGFTYFAERFAEHLGMQEAYANVLDSHHGQLTGQCIPPIVDGERKLVLLKRLCQQHGWSLQQSLAVGDGANDLPMLQAAGIGMAFHAKPIVQAQAPYHIQHFGLDALLYALGWQDDELV